MTTAASAADAATTARRRSAANKGGLQRAGYVAHRSPDPAAAAEFAVDHMGFSLVHVDADDRHYLAAEGLDPYSLVFVPGDKGIDHVSFVVPDLEALAREERRLRETGVEVERLDPNPLWRAAPSVRVHSPSGHAVHITPGVQVEAPMAALVVPGRPEPAPIAFDHIAVGTTDVEAEFDFAINVLGLSETARVDATDAGTVLGFCRAHTLFHCYTIVSLQRPGLHHYQYTLKNRDAVFATHEKMKADGVVEVLWGPLRHGPGHNVAIYFRDKDGSIVEYSAEEEVILDDDGYIIQQWSADDPAFKDEWGTEPPQIFFE